ncbi:MAG: type II toxin-antitoxin system RelE/ParE family toxin [bacterium]|nr:type II toxin-antitoxin system RelE/ParE family toxin [bacterium]
MESYRHRGLRRAHQRGNYHRGNATHADRIARVVATLQAATKPSDLDLPGYRLHSLKGNMEGLRSIRVSANWRIVFRMEGVHVYDVDLLDYHN